MGSLAVENRIIKRSLHNYNSNTLWGITNDEVCVVVLQVLSNKHHVNDVSHCNFILPPYSSKQLRLCSFSRFWQKNLFKYYRIVFEILLTSCHFIKSWRRNFFQDVGSIVSHSFPILAAFGTPQNTLLRFNMCYIFERKVQYVPHVWAEQRYRSLSLPGSSTTLQNLCFGLAVTGFFSHIQSRSQKAMQS